MVRTSTGVAERSKPETAPEKLTAADKRMARELDLDDATWGRIVEMGKSQQIDPAEVVRRAITQVYGSDHTTEAFNSGD